MAYGLKERDYTGAMQQGMNYGAQKAEQERRQPIVQQLEQLNLASKKQGLEAGKRSVTLQDLSIQERERKAESAEMADIGKAAAYAGSQDDPEAAWDEVLNFYEMQGKPINHMRDRSDLIPMMIELNNPDYAKQKAAQERIVQMIKTMPADKQAQAKALSAVDPKALSKSYAESMFQGSGDINQLIAPLNDEQKQQVSAVYSNDKDAGIKLASDLIKQKNKPKLSSEKKAEREAKQGLIDIEGSMESFESLINDPDFDGGVGWMDQYTGPVGATYGSAEGVIGKRAKRASRQLVLDAASSLSGSMSDADILLLSESAPSVGDDASVWRDWYNEDFKPAAKRAIQKQKIAAGIGESSKSELTTPKTKEEFDALNVGDYYIDPDDGKRYQKI